MSLTSDFINALGEKYRFSRYLEIGVDRGLTFLDVELEHKMGVDPHFLCDTDAHSSPQVQFFAESSDDFFARLPQRLQEAPFTEGSSAAGQGFAFDIIFIDGLHTFAQSYRDFLNSLPYSHEKTIWILGASVPSDPWSALPQRGKSLAYRQVARLRGSTWHGDVYKTVFALHDLHPEFSYATHIDNGEAQTIIWRNKGNVPREVRKGSIEAIDSLSYFDMLDQRSVLFPVGFEYLPEMIFKNIAAESYQRPCDIHLVVRPLAVDTVLTTARDLLVSRCREGLKSLRGQ